MSSTPVKYRSPQACGGGIKVGCAEAQELQRTVLGEQQERWLYDSRQRRECPLDQLAQQIIPMPNDRNPDPKVFAPMDKWTAPTVRCPTR